MFINFSNHPSKAWNQLQKSEAEKYGKIVDIPFPIVPAEADEKEIQNLTEQAVFEIERYLSAGSVVLVQGEFTLAYSIISMLNMMNIKTVAACSERIADCTVSNDGTIEKKSIFRFVKFRVYKNFSLKL